MKRNIQGQRFFFLTVLSENGRTKSREVKWLCLCDCGTHTTVRMSNLVNDKIKSCGCKQKELQSVSNLDHGGVSLGAKTPEYSSWQAMKARCYDPENVSYKNYGAKGVIVCDRWKSSFENFVKDMGVRPSSSHSIDRIENDGNYSPDNCRWATRSDQDNKKTTTYYVEFNGKTQSLSEWSREMKVNLYTLRYRLENDWSIKDALTCLPNTKYHRRKRK